MCSHLTLINKSAARERPVRDGLDMDDMPTATGLLSPLRLAGYLAEPRIRCCPVESTALCLVPVTFSCSSRILVS